MDAARGRRSYASTSQNMGTGELRAAYLQVGDHPQRGNVLIGDIAVLRADDFQERGTIGYCMGKAWWGKSIMTEALSEVLRYCFEEVGFFRIDGEHAAENIGSSRVMEKCGLVYEGTRRKFFRPPTTGKRVDIVDRGILREEYFNKRQNFN